MPEGALLTHTVEAVLHELADSGATGCLLVRDQEGDEAEVYLRDGQVYAVTVPGRRVMLGVRLMSRGALTPEALAEALEIQRTELQGWRLGELLVHLGYVELSVVEEFVVEHLKDALTDLLGWPVAAWKFRKNKKTRQDVAPPTPVAELFDDLRHRATTWETILDATGGPDTVPTLAAASPSDEVALGPNEWALLCKVDDTRSVTELAGECGFTLFEAGQVVMRLVEAGLVAVQRQPVEVAEVEPADDSGVELVLPVVALEELEAREAAEAQAAQAEQEAKEAKAARAEEAKEAKAARAAQEALEAQERAEALERERAEQEALERAAADEAVERAEALAREAREAQERAEQAERDRAETLARAAEEERERAEAAAREAAERTEQESGGRGAAEQEERERVEAQERAEAEAGRPARLRSGPSRKSASGSRRRSAPRPRPGRPARLRSGPSRKSVSGPSRRRASARSAGPLPTPSGWKRPRSCTASWRRWPPRRPPPGPSVPRRAAGPARRRRRLPRLPPSRPLPSRSRPAASRRPLSASPPRSRPGPTTPPGSPTSGRSPRQPPGPTTTSG